MLRNIFLIVISFLIVHCIYAQDNTPKYSNEFLNVGVDARAFGMGLSMVSHVNDVSAGYWNPAGLAELHSDYQLELMHSAYFGGISNYDYAAFAARMESDAVLSISMIRFAVDDIPDTRLLFDANGAINYDNIAFFSAADYGFYGSYARELKVLGGLNLGGSVKIIRRVVGDFADAWGFGMDFGLQKQTKNWGFGIMAKDIFGTFNSWTINEEELRDIYSTTGNDLYTQSLEITLPRIVIGAYSQFELGKKFSLLSSLDVVTTTDGKRNALLQTELISVDPRAGFELGYNRAAFLRGGIGQFQQIKDYDGSYSWTFQPNIGVGFKIQQVDIDYSFTDLVDLSPGLYSHVFSIKVNFDVE